jgi:hypothetical protein
MLVALRQLLLDFLSTAFFYVASWGRRRQVDGRELRQWQHDASDICSA